VKTLSLDGGGVFGVGQSLILSQLDNSKWDVVCGSSIGSAVAACIAIGKRVDVNFFRTYMPRIFKNHWYVNPIFGSRYSDNGINRSLQEIFGNRTLKETRIPIFITAASIDQHTPKVFYSGNIEDGNMLISDVVRCSCSAPTYFKPWLGYTDGGVFANNPALVLVAKTMNEFGVSLNDIELCSIGTGTFSRSGRANSDNILFWSKWLITSLLEGGSDKLFDDMACTLPLKKYKRYQFVKRTDWKIDSVEDMEQAITDWSGQAMFSSQQINECFLSDENDIGSVFDLDKSEQYKINKEMENGE